MTELVNVSLAAALSGVSVGDGFVLNNAHMVKLPPATTTTSIAGHANDDFYSFRGHSIYFRGTSRCAGRVARVVSYDAASKCAILGSENEVGDYLASSVVAAADLAGEPGSGKGLGIESESSSPRCPSETVAVTLLYLRDWCGAASGSRLLLLLLLLLL
eukprot:1420226-Rhodomonas_salina.1